MEVQGSHHLRAQTRAPERYRRDRPVEANCGKNLEERPFITTGRDSSRTRREILLAGGLQSANDAGGNSISPRLEQSSRQFHIATLLNQRGAVTRPGVFNIDKTEALSGTVHSGACLARAGGCLRVDYWQLKGAAKAGRARRSRKYALASRRFDHCRREIRSRVNDHAILC